MALVEESRFYGRIGEFPRSRTLNWVSMAATGDLVCFQCFHLFFFLLLVKFSFAKCILQINMQSGQKLAGMQKSGKDHWMVTPRRSQAINFIPGHGKLMVGAGRSWAQLTGGQIKAVRSRSTPDSGQEGGVAPKRCLGSRVSAALKKRMHLIQFEKRTQ